MEKIKRYEMENYYVSGFIELEGTVVHVDDETAEFFTLYEKKQNGQSHVLLDCVDRLSVEAVMAVYVERDALQEQVRALADGLENMAGAMLNLTLDSGSKQAVAYAYCADMVAKFAAKLREGEQP